MFFLFAVGLCLGSFLSATARRTANKKINWLGRSRCPHCKKNLSIKELVPLFGFIFLKGRCLSCKKPISRQEPIVELISGFLFLIIGLIHPDFGWLLWRDLVFTGFFILLFLTDARTGTLPYKFTLPATAVAIIFNLTPLQLYPLTTLLSSCLLGSILCGGFFYFQHLISRGRWVGGGDAGMGFFLGAALGLWPGILTIGLAYVLGAAYAIILLVGKRATIKSAIPFGPFLALAGWLILIFN